MLLVLSSFPDADTAAQIVRTLVEEKIVACGTILPVGRSIYAWEGKIEDKAEVLVLFKTADPNYAKLEKRLHKIHPYEIPEIIACEAGAVAKNYAAWVEGATA